MLAQEMKKPLEAAARLVLGLSNPVVTGVTTREA